MNQKIKNYSDKQGLIGYGLFRHGIKNNNKEAIEKSLKQIQFLESFFRIYVKDRLGIL